MQRLRRMTIEDHRIRTVFTLVSRLSIIPGGRYPRGSAFGDMLSAAWRALNGAGRPMLWTLGGAWVVSDPPLSQPQKKAPTDH